VPIERQGCKGAKISPPTLQAARCEAMTVTCEVPVAADDVARMI